MFFIEYDCNLLNIASLDDACFSIFCRVDNNRADGRITPNYR